LRIFALDVSEPPGAAPGLISPPLTETSPTTPPLPPKTPPLILTLGGSSTPPLRSVVVPPVWVNVPPAPTTFIVTPLIVRLPALVTAPVTVTAPLSWN
jgi:hypothetical protein